MVRKIGIKLKSGHRRILKDEFSDVNRKVIFFGIFCPRHGTHTRRENTEKRFPSYEKMLLR